MALAEPITYVFLKRRLAISMIWSLASGEPVDSTTAHGYGVAEEVQGRESRVKIE